nr:tyrosine-type recombinase/integrase [Eubacteriales bacterium]
MEILRKVSIQQKTNRLRYADMYYNGLNLVFTDPLGKNLVHRTVVKHFKHIVNKIGAPNVRFHDLRHTYAVMALQAGDDIKTVQETLGHATAAFTLEVYSHVTQDMKKDSAARMENYIKNII